MLNNSIALEYKLVKTLEITFKKRITFEKFLLFRFSTIKMCALIKYLFPGKFFPLLSQSAGPFSGPRNSTNHSKRRICMIFLGWWVNPRSDRRAKCERGHLRATRTWNQRAPQVAQPIQPRKTASRRGRKGRIFRWKIICL